MAFDSIRLLGVRIHKASLGPMVSQLAEWSGGTETRLCFYANAHVMNLAFEKPSLRDALNEADLVFCDGFGVSLASRIIGDELPERMSPPDWIDDLGELLAARNAAVYVVGDEAAVVEGFAETFEGRHPGLRVCGVRDGFFDVTGPENDALIADIEETNSDVVLVGMGSPRQELWAVDNRSAMEQVGVVLAVGGMFRWYIGAEKRAPAWMTYHGLEWLARLAGHPIRHFQRYVVGLPKFFLRVFLSRVADRRE